MKKKIFSIAVCLFLIATVALNIGVASVNRAEIITDVTKAVDNGYIFKTFEVNVAESGEYFTEFWVMPAKYADNGYTTFMVYVNDEFVGKIIPTKSNWQSARVYDKEALYLKAGLNRISVATCSPEVPAVETIKIAKTDHEARISSDNYVTFLQDVSEGTLPISNTTSESVQALSTDATGSVIAEFNAQPLNYTFWHEGLYTDGDEIYITTSSSVPHCIELYLFGTPLNGQIVHSSSDSPNIGLPGSGPGIGQIEDKTHIMYTPASEYQMRTINFRGVSERTLNNTAEVATLRYTAPIEGYYIFRVRTLENEISGLADVTVNGNYFYENVPNSCNFINNVIPVDNNEYSIMTRCENPEKDDPYLFIHRDRNYNIIGYNDDNKDSDIREQYNICKRDSYFSQKFQTKAAGLSISNYSSSNPASTCDVIVAKITSSTQSFAARKNGKSNTTGVTEISVSNCNVKIPGAVEQGGNLNLYADKCIENVKVYNLTGMNIGSVECKDVVLSLSLEELNISQPGIYVVAVTTVDGMVSGKVLVK